MTTGPWCVPVNLLKLNKISFESFEDTLRLHVGPNYWCKRFIFEVSSQEFTIVHSLCGHPELLCI